MLTQFKTPLGKRFLRRILPGFLCGLCLVLTLRSPATAQSAAVNRAEITQILDSPKVFIQNRQAKVNDRASKGQRVRTANARAQLLFNTGAIGRLSPNSVLTVGQQCARLQKGSLLVNGAMNGCASSVIAGVRGTTYLLEVNDAGEAAINVLEGEVAVTKLAEPLPVEDATADFPVQTKQFPGNFRLPDPTLRRPTPPLEVETPASNGSSPLDLQTSQDRGETVVLQAGEKVSVGSDGSVGLIQKLSQEEFTRLLRGNLFNGFSSQLPGISKIQQSFQRLYPNVPFPLSLPGIPGIPTPSIPIRLPF